MPFWSGKTTSYKPLNTSLAVVLLMHLPQPGVGDMSVDLRSGNAGVTEHFLDGANVSTVLQ